MSFFFVSTSFFSCLYMDRAVGKVNIETKKEETN